ncbi:MAG: DUF5818 domain-containing protein [Pseudomonadota bacterium]
MGTRQWQGRLEKGPLGPGIWKLEADDGRAYQLVGDIPARLEGKRVVVTGERDGLLGLAVLAGVIRVEQIREEGGWR